MAEALAAGIRPSRIFAHVDDPGLAHWPEAVAVTAAVMRRLADTDHPRGPVAVIDIPPPTVLPADRHLLVLCGVADPGNVGTLVRSAAAFGLGVVWTPGSADPWSPKALRAGAGAHFRCPLSPADDPAALFTHRLVAAVAKGGDHPRRLGAGPWAILLGSEAHGLPQRWQKAANAAVSIPMPGGTESLNVAAAGSILAYLLGSESFPHPH